MNQLIENCEHLDSFDELKEAKEFTRKLRGELPLNSTTDIKMIQASTQIQALELLHKKVNKTNGKTHK